MSPKIPNKMLNRLRRFILSTHFYLYLTARTAQVNNTVIISRAIFGITHKERGTDDAPRNTWNAKFMRHNLPPKWPDKYPFKSGQVYTCLQVRTGPKSIFNDCWLIFRNKKSKTDEKSQPILIQYANRIYTAKNMSCNKFVWSRTRFSRSFRHRMRFFSLEFINSAHIWMLLASLGRI